MLSLHFLSASATEVVRNRDPCPNRDPSSKRQSRYSRISGRDAKRVNGKRQLPFWQPTPRACRRCSPCNLDPELSRHLLHPSAFPTACFTALGATMSLVAAARFPTACFTARGTACFTALGATRSLVAAAAPLGEHLEDLRGVSRAVSSIGRWGALLRFPALAAASRCPALAAASAASAAVFAAFSAIFLCLALSLASCRRNCTPARR